jgi:hypothetical protein
VQRPDATKTWCRETSAFAQASEQMSRHVRGNQKLKSDTPMTDRNLKNLVTEAVTLNREINEEPID